MRWHKGSCSYCQAGDVKSVDVIRVSSDYWPLLPSDDLTMCRICDALGISPYPAQNREPVTRSDLARAVRLILGSKAR